MVGFSGLSGVVGHVDGRPMAACAGYAWGFCAAVSMAKVSLVVDGDLGLALEPMLAMVGLSGKLDGP